jgi:hypothetical protein
MSGVTLEDFVYLAPKRRFVLLTKQRWVRAGVDAALPPVDGMPASRWLQIHRSVFSEAELEAVRRRIRCSQ